MTVGDAEDDDRGDDDDERRPKGSLSLCFSYTIQKSVRPDWRCRGCVVIIIMMTVGDAEDAR